MGGDDKPGNPKDGAKKTFKFSGMYPETGPVPEWSWDRLKYFIYKDQYFYNPPKPGTPEWEIELKEGGFKDTIGKHLPKGVRIPDWGKYQIENSTDLMKLQQKLSAEGLKFPWLRNEVWRWDWRLFGTRTDRWLFILKYVKYGLAAFVVTETCAYLLGWRPRFHDPKWYPDPHHEDKYTMLYEMAPETLEKVRIKRLV